MISLPDLLQAPWPYEDSHRDAWARLVSDLVRLDEFAKRFRLIPSSDLAIIVEAFRGLSPPRAEIGKVCVVALRDMLIALDPRYREILADLIGDRRSRRPLELRTYARRYVAEQLSDPAVRILYEGLDDAPYDILRTLRALDSLKLLGTLQPKACMALAEAVSHLLYAGPRFGAVHRFSVVPVPDKIRGRRINSKQRWYIIDRYTQSSLHTFDDISEAEVICASINRDRSYGEYYASLGMIAMHMELLNSGSPGRPLLEGVVEKLSGLKRDLLQILREADAGLGAK